MYSQVLAVYSNALANKHVFLCIQLLDTIVIRIQPGKGAIWLKYL